MRCEILLLFSGCVAAACGARPVLAAPPPGTAEVPVTAEEAEAERRLVALIAGERDRAGRSALARDPHLDRMARAHSLDMQAGGYVGHTSPTSGDTLARARAAGPVPPLLLENVGRADTVEGAHAALLASPGHRANILHVEPTHLGVGVRIVPRDGRREVWVTQLFARLLAPWDEARARREALDRIAELRREARGELRENQPGLLIRRALRRVTRPMATSIIAVRATDPGRMTATPSLADPAWTRLGLGLAPIGLREGRPSAVWVVLLLADE